MPIDEEQELGMAMAMVMGLKRSGSGSRHSRCPVLRKHRALRPFHGIRCERLRVFSGPASKMESLGGNQARDSPDAGPGKDAGLFGINPLYPK